MLLPITLFLEFSVSTARFLPQSYSVLLNASYLFRHASVYLQQNYKTEAEVLLPHLRTMVSVSKFKNDRSRSLAIVDVGANRGHFTAAAYVFSNLYSNFWLIFGKL